MTTRGKNVFTVPAAHRWTKSDGSYLIPFNHRLAVKHEALDEKEKSFTSVQNRKKVGKKLKTVTQKPKSFSLRASFYPAADDEFERFDSCRTGIREGLLINPEPERH
jgi:hypothetical protein